MKTKNLFIATLVACASVGSIPAKLLAQTNNTDSLSMNKIENTIFKKLGDKFNVNLLLRSSANYGMKMVGNEKATNLNVDEARLEVVGKIYPELGYRLRYRMQRTPLSTSQDAANNALDIAYVQYQFANKTMEVTFGKQGNIFGSYEFILNPTFEYRYTDMVNSIMNIFPMAVNLAANINSNHSFTLQVYNTTNNSFNEHNTNLKIFPTDLTASRVPLGGNLLWSGCFFDKNFTTKYSLGMNSYASGKAGTNIALGHQYKAGKIFSYLDLFQANLPVDYTSLSNKAINDFYSTNTLARDIIYRTAVMRFDYLVAPKWNVSLKCFIETASKYNDKNFGQNFRQNLGYLTTIEYQPFADQSLKFFANYFGQNISYKNAAATVAKNQDMNIFSLGFLWYVNPFKF